MCGEWVIKTIDISKRWFLSFMMGTWGGLMTKYYAWSYLGRWARSVLCAKPPIFTTRINHLDLPLSHEITQANHLISYQHFSWKRSQKSITKISKPYRNQSLQVAKVNGSRVYRLQKDTRSYRVCCRNTFFLPKTLTKFSTHAMEISTLKKCIWIPTIALFLIGKSLLYDCLK